MTPSRSAGGADTRERGVAATTRAGTAPSRYQRVRSEAGWGRGSSSTVERADAALGWWYTAWIVLIALGALTLALIALRTAKARLGAAPRGRRPVNP